MILYWLGCIGKLFLNYGRLSRKNIIGVVELLVVGFVLFLGVLVGVMDGWGGRLNIVSLKFSRVGIMS